MRISRRQLRAIIAEAIRIRKPIFSKVEPEEIDAMRQAARDEAGIDDMIGPEKAEKLRLLDQEPGGKDQVRSIYQAFGSNEPDITSSQEEAFFQAQSAHDKKIEEDNYQEVSEMLLRGGADTLNAIATMKRLGMFRSSPVGLMDYYPTMEPEQIQIVGNFTKEAHKSFTPVLKKVMKADSTSLKLPLHRGLIAVRGYAGAYAPDNPVLPSEPYGGIAIHLDGTYANTSSLRITIRGGKHLKQIKSFISSLYSHPNFGE